MLDRISIFSNSGKERKNSSHILYAAEAHDPLYSGAVVPVGSFTSSPREAKQFPEIVAPGLPARSVLMGDDRQRFGDRIILDLHFEFLIVGIDEFPVNTGEDSFVHGGIVSVHSILPWLCLLSRNCLAGCRP
jgi:hypothetical protein